MSLSATSSTPPAASADPAELRALIEQLGQRLEEAKQELKSDIQSKLPSARRFSWVLLFIAIQVVQGVIVVRYTVRAAATALDSANIPEMTARYSEALHQSQGLVSALNQNVATLGSLVGETTDAWKKHVQGFIRELPRVQEGYERAATRFTTEAGTLPARIVDRFFEADEVKRSMASYSAGVESAAMTVQQRSDDGLAAAVKAYETRITAPESIAHFEKQVERKFDENKERIAEVVAGGLKEALQAGKLGEKLGTFWDAGLAAGDGAAKADGWLQAKLREKAEAAPIEQALVKSVDAALLPPLQKWFEAQLSADGPLAAQLQRDQDKVPALPQLVAELVKSEVHAALLPDGEKVPKLEEILRDVVKTRVNLTLAAMAPSRGPVVLTCK